MSGSLRFPTEVCTFIFQHLFAGKRVKYDHYSNRTRLRAAHKILAHFRTTQTLVSIFGASRQCLAESRPIFFEEVTITLNTLIDPYYKSFSSPIVSPWIIKYATIKLNVASREMPDDLSRVVNALPNLKTLEYTTCGVPQSSKIDNTAIKTHMEAIKAHPSNAFRVDPAGYKVREKMLSITKSWQEMGGSFDLIYAVPVAQESDPSGSSGPVRLDARFNLITGKVELVKAVYWEDGVERRVVAETLYKLPAR